MIQLISVVIEITSMDGASYSIKSITHATKVAVPGKFSLYFYSQMKDFPFIIRRLEIV